MRGDKEKKEKRPSLLVVEPSVEILTPIDEIMEYPRRIEVAGRTCYRSEHRITNKTAEPFVEMLIKRGHESVLEHCSVTVKYVGDRAMSHQLVRHRVAASYSQESQRYCNYSKDKALKVVVPPSINTRKSGRRWLHPGDIVRGDIEQGKMVVERECEKIGVDFSKSLLRWVMACTFSYEVYLDLLAAAVRPEDARSVLPNATATTVATTFNLRQWRHFFNVRCDKHAQWQIRGLAMETLSEFYDLMPCVFKDIAGKFEEDDEF